MNKPTLEEYEKAKKDFENYCSWARMARSKQGELIDSLAEERRNEVFYLEQAEKQREVLLPMRFTNKQRTEVKDNVNEHMG